jgi:large subunit ribosomal protein L4
VTTVNVQSTVGDLARTVELPDEIFNVEVKTALMHQVVVAQLAAARQGTHATKTRGMVSGGGRKPYRQKGTGRARQGSIRAPQFAGGGIVHGPQPRDYAQRTPKKMKVAALRGALTDRARDGRVHVVAGLVSGDAPSTKAAVKALAAITVRRHVLVVIERSDELTWKSLRNVASVHLLHVDQLNTYDVLVSDDVVFTEGALAAFVAGPARGKGASAVARASEIEDLAAAVSTLAPGPTDSGEATVTAAEEAPVTDVTDSADLIGEPATDAGSTRPAGAGVSDEEAVTEVVTTTDSNLLAETAYETEGADVPSAQEVDRGES